MKIKTLIFILIFMLPVLSGCQNSNQFNEKNNSQTIDSTSQQADFQAQPKMFNEFSGEPGTEVELKDQMTFDTELFNERQAQFFNTEINGVKVYFFIVKDMNGIYRAAANACQVCAEAKMGFHQEGNYMVCNTCGNKYPLEKIATEKGGCNPAPIDPDLKVENGQVILAKSDLIKIADYFE